MKVSPLELARQQDGAPDQKVDEPDLHKHPLRNRGLYRLQSRNLAMGVYKAKSERFIGMKDYGNLTGKVIYWEDKEIVTVTDFLEMCPVENLTEIFSTSVGNIFNYYQNQPLLDWLIKKQEQYHESNM